MRNAVMIACGRGKQSGPAPAATLYTGQQFRLARRAAASLSADLYIVSGLHGIVPADRVLAPYDRVMSSDGRTPQPVDAGLVGEINRHPLVVALLPLPYRRHVARAGVRIDLDAFTGCTGIGQQRSVAAALTRGVVRIPATDPVQVGRAMLAQHRLTAQPDHGLLLRLARGGWTAEQQRLTGPVLPRSYPGERAWLMPLDSHGEQQMAAAMQVLTSAGIATTALSPADGSATPPVRDPLLDTGDNTLPHPIARCLR